jgi:hypothetical protein
VQRDEELGRGKRRRKTRVVHDPTDQEAARARAIKAPPTSVEVRRGGMG